MDEVWWYRFHGIASAAAFAVFLPLSLVLGRFSLITAGQRFFSALHFIAALAACVAAVGGSGILYWKIPEIRNVDKLKSRHGMLGAAVLFVLLLIALNGFCICFRRKSASGKRTGFWSKLHRFLGVLVILAAGYESYNGIYLYHDLTADSRQWVYIGVYGACAGALFVVYFILHFVPFYEAPLKIIAKDVDMVASSKSPKKNADAIVWPPSEVMWPSSRRAMLANGNIDTPTRLITATESPPSAASQLPRSKSEQSNTRLDVEAGKARVDPALDVETGKASVGPAASIDDRGKRSPVVYKGSPSSVGSYTSYDTYTSHRAEGFRVPAALAKPAKRRPSEVEKVVLAPAPPRKPRHPGDNSGAEP